MAVGFYFLLFDHYSEAVVVVVVLRAQALVQVVVRAAVEVHFLHLVEQKVQEVKMAGGFGKEMFY